MAFHQVGCVHRQRIWRQRGMVLLKWTLIAAAGFFGVLILERLALML